MKLHIKVKDDEEFEESLVSEIFFHPIILMKTGFINSVQQLLRGDETEQNRNAFVCKFLVILVMIIRIVIIL